MNRSDVVFIDTETTGLHPLEHEIWEIATIEWNSEVKKWEPWQTFVRYEHLSTADPVALQIGRFEERYNPDKAMSMAWALRNLRSIVRGKHLVGAIPSFDEERLRHAGYAHNVDLENHYHLIDIEAMVIGFLVAKKFTRPTFPLPWKSDAVSHALMGRDQPKEWKHTALGDAAWVLRQFGTIFQWPETQGEDFFHLFPIGSTNA